MQHRPSSDWHHLSVADALARLESDATVGLTAEEAVRRAQRHGANTLPPQPGRGWVLRLASQFHQPLIYILNISAAISGFLGEWVDASVIFGVVLVNAGIGFMQESKAENAIAALARMVSTRATALRDGHRLVLPSAQLVPGDIVLLDAGDRVPADIRLTASRELRTDEAALTGESLPVAKSPAPLPLDTLLADRADVAFAGTLVVAGQGRGVVFAIGEATETGRISRLMRDADQLSTPLTRKIEGFSRILLYLILGLAAFTFAVGLWRGETAFDMFLAAVALSVGAIPEGLPAAVTVTLAIGVSRMAKRRAIVRRLPAVETLGSTTVICSDKTGTLTRNEMTVQSVFAGDARFQVEGVGYEPLGAVLHQGAPADVSGALHECLLAGVLCNDASVALKEGHWRTRGDPTEAALVVAAMKAGMDPDLLRARHPRRDEIPFDSRHQFMATLHADGSVFLKGAVEKVLARCAWMLAPDGGTIPLTPQAVERAAAEMAGQGLRVLALARKTAAPDQDGIHHHDLEHDMTFLGLQGMMDPPRPEAIRAVRACHRAGIAVKMITGDHPLTAAAVARVIGLAGDGGVLAGREIGALDDDALARKARVVNVFARVEPEQKLRLVRALQAGGDIVAMTGDGVNDAPALKQADIGVAMGISGTDVAKEAAAMVLTDDDFASIEAAVEEGRGVFDNLTKFIMWTLPTNFGEGLVITAAVVAGTALPILPVQILWINMTTAVLLGLMLSFEPIERGIMERPPRPVGAPLLNRSVAWRVAIVSALLLAGSFGLFNWEVAQGAPLAYARTVAANVFVVGETFYLFNCRSMTESMFSLGVFTNRWVVAGVTLTILLQILFTYLPAMNAWFGTAPIDARAWAHILAVGAAIHIAVGFEKWLAKR